MHRKIKSYVLRAGRTSPRQKQGLDDYLALYTLPQNMVWDIALEFGRCAKTIVEIGFGMGQSLLQQAQAQPECNFIGIEVHRAGLGSLAANLQALQIPNVRIAPYDAVDVFNHCIASKSLDGIQIFFPDPWPKKRHHKRRLIQPDFIQLLSQKIKPNGFIHCATDWQEYAEHMHTVLSQCQNLQNQSSNAYSPRPLTRPLTAFEQRGLNLGHSVRDLIYTRVLA